VQPGSRKQPVGLGEADRTGGAQADAFQCGTAKTAGEVGPVPEQGLPVERCPMLGKTIAEHGAPAVVFGLLV